MKTRLTAASFAGLYGRDTRGSVLITALIFAIIIGITLVGYVKLSTNSLKLAHRTFFADAANNLAEAGTEEAMWSFNTLGNSTGSTATTAAWRGVGGTWTIGNLSSIYMSSMGSGYSSAPTVSISGGGGSGATATATVSTYYVTVSGVTTAITGVTGITITNFGSGYTSAPTVTLSGGGGTGAAALARLAATRTFTFSNLGQNASGTVKVWVDGYDGTNVIPVVVSKATITPFEGAPIEKIVKVIISKSGLLPKGLIAKNGIQWNGHPIANSFISSTVPGVQPFTPYDVNTARANITVGSMYGPEIDLGAQGVVSGNVMLGPGVTVTGNTSGISGQTIGNLSYSFTMPTYPTNIGGQGYFGLGTMASLPATLPRAGDLAAADGKYYYFVNGATIGATTFTAGKKVVVVGTSTQMTGGLQINVPAVGVANGKVEIYMDGPMSPGNSSVNTTNWAGALEIYTTTTQTCTISGNGYFAGCLFAPNAELRGNGGGNNTQDLCGSFVVGSVTSNGHMSFHYDEGLGGAVNPKPWNLGLWTELQTSAERALYARQLNF